MNVELDPEIAKALYKRLLTAVKLQDGTPVYTVSVNLARELREIISAKLGV